MNTGDRFERLRAQIKAINSSMDHHAKTADAKLAVRDAEIERLRAEVERLAAELAAEHEAEYKRCACEVDPCSETGEPYAWCVYHKKMRDELAAERQRARLPEELVDSLKGAIENAKNWTAEEWLDIAEDIISWHDNG